MKTYFTTILKLIIAMILCSSVAAATPLFGKLTIALEEESPSQLFAKPNTWKERCSKIGNSLMLGKSPFELGVFTQFECVTVDENTEDGKGWILKFRHSDELRISLKYGGKSYYYFKIDSNFDAHDGLMNPKFLDRLAFSILNDLPAMGRLNPTKLVNGMYTLPANSSVAAHSKIMLYRLDKAGPYWRGSPIDSAKLVDSDSNVSWKLKKPKRVKNSKEIWIHSLRGPGSNSRKIKEGLKEAFVDSPPLGGFSLHRKIINRFGLGSAAIGVRYGIPLISTDEESSEFLNQLNFVGILAELNSGPLSGLKIYVDIAPEVRIQQGDSETYFGWQRSVIAWGFGHDFDSFFKRIVFSPKLGYWTMDVNLPNEGDERDFKHKFSVPSVGGELSLEMAALTFLIRTWAAADFGVGSMVTTNKETITNSRIGTDIFLPGPDFSMFGVRYKTLPYIFAFGEAVDIQKPESSVGEDAKLSYSTAYAGGGIAISW